MKAFFKDDDFDFLTRLALGAAFYGAADVGEVLGTVDGVKDGDAQQWLDAWSATAARLEDEAVTRLHAGHTRSAAAAFLRAATYYEKATYSAWGVKGASPFDAIWEKHRECWDSFLRHCEWDDEAIEIPYEDTTLPGYVVRSGTGSRRTLIMNNGSDGSMVDMWVQGALEALRRGWNVALFDGPGQQAALVRQGLHFRPDWEAVVTPVVDALAARDDVDPDRLAILGVSQAGYWVPRALSREHRLAAAVVDPGVVDVSTTLLDHLPHRMVRMLENGEKERFDRDMKMGERFSRKNAATIALRFRPYGLDSEYEVYRRALEFRLTDDDIAAITTPMCVTDPDDEQFWPGQPAELYDKLGVAKVLLRFTADEGANWHCEPMGLGVRSERIFDWLDDTVPPDDQPSSTSKA
jgi:hypothetical protein